VENPLCSPHIIPAVCCGTAQEKIAPIADPIRSDLPCAHCCKSHSLRCVTSPMGFCDPGASQRRPHSLRMVIIFPLLIITHHITNIATKSCFLFTVVF
jgi:hypothetical protein